MLIGVFASRTLEGIHFVFREGSDWFDLPVSQGMHSASRVLPLSGGHELSIPGAGHFENVVVVPVFAAPAAWVMRDFSDGYGLVSIFSKPLRHAWGNGRIGRIQLLSPREEGLVAIGTVLPRKHRVARGAAGGGVDVVVVKGSAGGRESVDIRRVNVVDAKGLQLGTKVVDADEQDILLFRSAIIGCGR